ncbi:MAG: hypothetical protein V3W20_12590 [Candidatus Neomarinimicrobiota bacterium]
MNKKIIISFGYVAIFISALKSMWDIDVSMGAVISRGQVILYGGAIPTLDFYHSALIRLLFSIFLLFSITLYLIIKDE